MSRSERRRAGAESSTAPESSIRLRGLVLAAVMVSVAAVVAQGSVDPLTAVGSLVLIPVAFWISHVRRAHRNAALKVVLAFGLLAALGAFLSRVRLAGSVDDAREALASLFLWVQILHSFDLPRRRDLAFSMASSVILMAQAGSLSLDTSFGVFLVPYAALAAAWLYVSHRSDAASRADVVAAAPVPRGRAARATALRAAVRPGVAALLATLLVFLALPRMEGLAVTRLPFEITRRSPVGGFSGQVVNPGLPARRGGVDGPAPFLPGAYPGFGDSVDLRSRGVLSDVVVLKVRAPHPSLYRGQVYDRFDGTRWTAGDTETERVGGPAPIRVPAREGPIRGPELVQTFYVQHEQPNVVFAAARADELYFPTSSVEVDRYGSIRAPFFLEQGMVYSVVSRIPEVFPNVLRASDRDTNPDLLRRYTQLPAELPGRIRELAIDITRGLDNDYDRALAVQEWLRENTVYDLGVPPEPPGADPMEVFLFERRRGYCEHIASAMAVLLRSIGVPARIAVGFGPGSRNHLTGYFEVAESDAHAWVEVLFPGSGWIEFDPTFGVPARDLGSPVRFIAPEVIRKVATFLGGLIPAPVREAVKSAGAAVAAAARAAASAWPALVVIAPLLVAALLVRRPRARRRRAPPLSPAAAAFVSMCGTFARRGLERPPSRTPHEHLARLVAADDLARREHAALATIVRTFEDERFSAEPPGDDRVADATKAAERLELAARALRD